MTFHDAVMLWLAKVAVEAVIGGVVFLLFAAGFVVFYLRKRR